jgi:hypothetical protein
MLIKTRFTVARHTTTFHANSTSGKTSFGMKTTSPKNLASSPGRNPESKKQFQFKK